MKVCKHPGCNKGGRIRKGYCESHYRRILRGVDLFSPTLQERSAARKANSEEYTIWKSMKQRCYNKNGPEYSKYGGRNIKVCDRWMEKGRGFINFIDDMGPRPRDKYPSGRSKFSIERRDNNANYSPENCYWADASTQRINQRRIKVYMVNEVIGNLSELHKKLSPKEVTERAVRSRLSLGWNIEDAILKPKWYKPNYKEKNANRNNENR